MNRRGYNDRSSVKEVQIVKKYKDYLYIAPAVILISVFFISSIIFAVRLSFFEWDGFSDMKFVGFENYVAFFTDKNFQISLMNTFIWVMSSLVLSMGVPLLFALLITNSRFPTMFKHALYLPKVLSGTIGGVVTASLLSIYGIPHIMEVLGFEELVFDWLSIPYVNTFIMIIMGVWQGIGLNMVVFIAGLNSLDYTSVEAALIEGAGTIKIHTKVIFPLLKPTILVVLVQSLVGSFNVFDSIWVMTKGGPYRTSETLALTMYQESFVYNRLGKGAAVAVVLTILVLCVAGFNLKNMFKEEKEG